MESIYYKIQELEHVAGFSKHEQVVRGVINAIDDKIVSQGSMLPSINQMVKELGFASKTIVKAYNDLKERGLVESKNRKGYFVVNEDTDKSVKVALLLYSFYSIQQDFYNAFRNELGDEAHVEVFFHHNNIDVFETMIGNISGRYGMYVIAPIPNPKTVDILKKLPSNKLLLVDRFEKLNYEANHVTQEFEINTYMALKELVVDIKKYESITFYFNHETDAPIEILRAFEKFTSDYNITGHIEKEYQTGSLKSGHAYFTLVDRDLWKVLKDSKVKNLEVGKDIGVISHNDDPVKEIICGGITTFSTDFERMGQRAAQFVLDRKPVQEVIPTILIRRKSI